MSGDIILNIDRIVLHGLDHVDGQTLTTALQQALAEQLSSSPVNSSAEMARVQTRITLPEAFSAEQLGRTLAQCLHGVISDAAGKPAQGLASKRGGRPDA